MLIEDHPLWQTQLDLEARMISDGADAFRAALHEQMSSGDGASTGGGRKVVTDLIQPVSLAIAQFFDEAGSGKAGRRHGAFRLIGDLDPHLLAFIATKTALGQMLSRKAGAIPVQRVAEKIGAAVEAEAMVVQFQRRNPDLASAVLRRLDKTTSHVQHRRRVLVSAMHSVDFDPARWSMEERRLVGMKLLDLVVTVSGLFEIQPASYSAPYRVALSAEAVVAIDERNAVAELLKPRYMPCVVPPKAWTESGRGGGYHTGVTIERSRLVKQGFRTRKKTGGIAPLSPTVLAAVNLMQDTAWAVNKPVLDVAREVIGRGLDDLEVLPRVQPLEVPAKPFDIETNEPARKAWRAAASAVHSQNLTDRSRRKQVICTMAVAEEFSKFERIYFPYELDFRGRVYAVPQWLNPQGPDYAKGLLTFADGKPIGEGQGPGWLAIHGANSFGVDKVSLEERIDWVEQNRERIRAVASEPLSNLWWTEADSPWQFLAFAMEWTAYLRACDEGRGPAFVSRLPVMVDGTCNGLQHYSAMLRDTVGGAATNLVPATAPSDIYGVVAARVVETLKQDAARLSPFATRWLDFGINRKITKRPVMVLPYGGTFTSCREYVEDAVKERGKTPFSTEPIKVGDRTTTEEKDAIMYLAHCVWDSIGHVVIAARDAMKWLQEAVKVASNAGIEVLRWTTPSGFEVAQHYAEMKAKKLKTAFNGTVKMQLRFDEPTDKLNKRRQGTAVAPNFVHSLDAAAMHRTIETAHNNGVCSFAMVHDSYGTVAADLPMLAACLRTEFVQMYTEHNVLEEFADAIRRQTNIDIDLPPLPPMGSLDLSLVLQSDFFFA